MGTFQDLKDMPFGRLKVVERAENRGKATMWLCQCSCGNMNIISQSGLMHEGTQSCGCLQREIASKNGKKTITHGLSQTRIYEVWSGMMKRCHNCKTKRYADYGGRGITVCEEWHDVTCFYEWAIHNGYSDDLSIERIETNGNYEPSNCKWATRKEQNFNKRNHKYVTINGITKPMGMWTHEYGIGLQAMYMRLRRGHSGEDLLKPVETRFRNNK